MVGMVVLMRLSLAAMVRMFSREEPSAPAVNTSELCDHEKAASTPEPAPETFAAIVLPTKTRRRRGTLLVRWTRREQSRRYQPYKQSLIVPLRLSRRSD